MSRSNFDIMIKKNKKRSKKCYYYFVFIIKEIIFETITSFNLDYDNDLLFILIYHTNIKYKKNLN
jgi:hypothetical protein